MILQLQLALTILEAGKDKQMSQTGMAEQRDIGRRIRSRLLRKGLLIETYVCVCNFLFG